VFRGIVEPLLSSDVDLYWDSIVRKPAGHGREFRWHQDGGYGRTEPEGYITCWTPLAATSEENGCLWVVPGSHLAGMLPHDSLDSTAHAYSGLVADLPADAAPVPLPMEPGQVAVLHSFTLHRSGPNRSASPRTAYVAAYTRAGTRYLDPGLPSDAKAPAFRATGA
jgi:ectoine hydroxylase-related dioxygenase (phytanoyl-CoA dioxygenase family)